MAGLTPSSIPPEFWRGVRLFAMDVDGILTDGTVAVASDGTETKRFSVLDGLGLRRVLTAGIAVAWISGRESGATTVRANELKITRLIQGQNDKLGALRALADELKLSPRQCIYMGDDDIDAPALKWAGLGVTVPTAMPAAFSAAGCVTERAAGRGAVREVCELLLAQRSEMSGPGNFSR
jgi:3-deoxy-D-manno-octulosonate 8-phosphate phosphatase (KDO 8-P phosphatase)